VEDSMTSKDLIIYVVGKMGTISSRYYIWKLCYFVSKALELPFEFKVRSFGSYHRDFDAGLVELVTDNYLSSSGITFCDFQLTDKAQEWYNRVSDIEIPTFDLNTEVEWLKERWCWVVPGYEIDMIKKVMSNVICKKKRRIKK
jgi:hypothetical protein